MEAEGGVCLCSTGIDCQRRVDDVPLARDPTSLHLSGTLRLKVGICIEVSPRTHQSGSFELGVLSRPSGNRQGTS